MRRGLLFGVHRGVCAVGRPDLPLDGRRKAALLRCGDLAALENRSAAALWQMRRSPESTICVAVASTAGRGSPPGIRVRRRSGLLPREITVVRELRVTTPARTLLDLAGTSTRDDLRSAVKRTEEQRLFDLLAIRSVIEAHPGAPGRRRLLLVLEELGTWTPVTRSDLELAFRELVERFAIPRPVMNTLVEGQLVDAYWPRHRVVVELDGYEAHGTRAAFGIDRRRTNDLQLSGHLALRSTYVDVTRHAAATARRILAALGATPG